MHEVYVKDADGVEFFPTKSEWMTMFESTRGFPMLKKFDVENTKYEFV